MTGRHNETILGKGKWSKCKNIDRNVICQNCKNIFEVSPYRVGIAKFCSFKCRNEAYSKDKQYHRQHSDETKIKLSLMFRGEKSSSWRGGVQRDRHGCFQYRLWRKSVFERDNYTCQECGQKGGVLNADHIKPWSLFTNLRYDINNGRTLCVDCHKKTKTFGYNSRINILTKGLNYGW